MLSIFEAPGGGSAWVSTRELSLGFPDGCSFEFKDALMLTREELADLLDVDAARLAEAPSDRDMDALTRRRVLRCARLFALALHVLADRRAAARWLKTPQAELGGSVPLRLAQTEVGARTVERVLGRMESGA